MFRISALASADNFTGQVSIHAAIACKSTRLDFGVSLFVPLLASPVDKSPFSEWNRPSGGEVRILPRPYLSPLKICVYRYLCRFRIGVFNARYQPAEEYHEAKPPLPIICRVWRRISVNSFG